MHSKRKIFYCAGLISLIMLPLLCLYHFNKRRVFDHLHCLEVNYWLREIRNGAFSPVGFNPLAYDKKNFNRITLAGDSADQIKLAYARIAIHELIHQPDTTLGFEFILRDRAKYGSLVKLFDICVREEVPNYLNYQNKFWVFNWRPKIIEGNKNGYWICGTSSLRNRVLREASVDYAASPYAEALNLFKKFWISAVLFAVMIGLTVASKTRPRARNKI